ncbi:hypothetical protein JW935_05745 [candidate division KSB1 bacterium]|nr:hypothetical protein [candidate division KSB1 bacterium]
MKKFIIFNFFFLFLLSLLYCKKDESPLEPEKEKLFSPDDLLNLNLKNITSFWGEDSVDRVSDYVTGHFDQRPDHLGSIRCSNNSGNYVEVSVFESQKIAIEAQEERTSDVAALIFSGDTRGKEYEEIRDIYWSSETGKKIKEKWWWGIYIFGVQQRYFYINKWNTIIGVGYYYDNLSDSTRVLLEDTAIEIAKRVDALSVAL